MVGFGRDCESCDRNEGEKSPDIAGVLKEVDTRKPTLEVMGVS
jgi:hypothetical protein